MKQILCACSENWVPQRSQFLVLIKRSMAYGNKNEWTSLWYIYQASKLNNQPASQKSTRPKYKHSASMPNLDNTLRHKAIKIKKLRNLFKLHSIKAKLKQTTTVANYRPANHTRVKAAKNTWETETRRVFKFSRHPAQITGYFKHLRRVLFVNYTILFHQVIVI